MKKFKSFLLCLLAVSTAVVTGNSFADESFPTPDNSVDEQGEGKSAVSSKLAESVEKVAVPYADITEYLEKIGTVEGIDIYFKDKKIDDIIWEKHGGKPAKKSDYTPQQEKIADKIDEIEKLGPSSCATSTPHGHTPCPTTGCTVRPTRSTAQASATGSMPTTMPSSSATTASSRSPASRRS